VQQAAWDWGYLHDYLRFFITGVTILVGTGGQACGCGCCFRDCYGC
jgi:hypothetical protein